MIISKWNGSEAEKLEILELTEKVYGKNEYSSPKYFDWLYEQNPYGKALIMIARDEKSGKLIGIEPAVPIILTVDQKPELAFLSCNSAVDSEYRNRGIFSKLVIAIQEEVKKYNTSCIFGIPNKNSFHVFTKYGFTEIANLPLLVKSIKFSNILKNPLSVLITSLIHHNNSKDEVQNFILEDKFDQRFDELIVKAEQKNWIIPKRDKNFLNWRYKQHPSRNYQVFYLNNGDDLISYIVMRETLYKERKIGVIMDFVVDPNFHDKNKVRNFLSGCINSVEKKCSVIISTCNPNTVENYFLKKAGFFSTPRFLKPEPLYFIMSVTSKEEKFKKLESYDNWFFTFGDYDVF